MNEQTVPTASPAAVQADIIGFFKREILNNDEAEIGPDDEIISQGLIDSMGIVRLLTYVQKRYAIADFDNRDLTLDNFRTIERVVALVMRYTESPARAL